MGLLAIGLVLTLSAGTDSQTAAAKRLAARGTKEYAAGKYEEAARDLLAAFQLLPAPTLLFNLGQCERAQGHLEQAISFYRSYLDAAPNASNAAVVKEKLQEALKAKEVRDRAAASGPPAPAVLVVPSTPGATRVASASSPTKPSTGEATASAPAGAVSASPTPGWRAHWVGESLAAGAVVCAAFAIVGLVRVGQYLQLQGQSNLPAQHVQAGSDLPNADNWAVASVVLGIAAAGGTTGAIFTW